MDQKELNPTESLALIQSMINTAKNRLADDGFHIIFWGWLVFSCSLINYAGIVFNIHAFYLVWAVLLPLGAIVSIVYSRIQNKKENVKTYIDTYMGYCLTAFGIALGLTLIFMPVHSMKVTYFFLMQLYGIVTLILGGLLSFRPLVIGSFFSFASAVVSVFLAEREQFLCIAAALLFSYIIPGHLLRSQYKSEMNV